MGAPVPPPARPRTQQTLAGLELAKMKIEKKAWDAIQNCLALINSYPRRDLPSAPEHPNIVTAAAARPSPAAGRCFILGRRWCSRLLALEHKLLLPTRQVSGGCWGLWDVGGGGWVAIPVCTAPAMGLQPSLQGYSPACPMAACQLPENHPKNPAGAGAAHSITPGRWDGVLLIPCPPTRWDEGTDVLGLAGAGR